MLKYINDQVNGYTSNFLYFTPLGSSSRYSANEGTPPLGVTSGLQGIFTQLVLDV